MPYEEFLTAPPLSRGGRDIPRVSERPFNPDEGNRILVRGFVVDGVTPNFDLGLTKESVQAAADEAFMKESGGTPEARMTVGHMVRVSDAVTTHYRAKGYLVAKAFLPVQTVGPDSLVHIQVIEGRITEVTVENAKKYKPDVLKKPCLPLVGTVPVRDSVESALLYTQDYPGVRLFGTFRPGAKQGETKLVLQVLEEDSFGFQAGADNYGTEFTGQYRLRLDTAWKNPVGWGDQLTVSVLQSVAPANTTYGSLGYAVPVGPRGFAVFGEFSQNGFTVDEKPFDQLKLEGTITAYEAGVDWRYVRGRFANARATLSYVNKHSELTGLGGLPIADDTFSVVELNSEMDRIDLRFRGVDQIGAKIRNGVSGDFGTASGLDPKFTSMEARYTRLQSLSETQSVVLRLRGQSAEQALSPLEQFALAGPDVVRAYPVGQILKDEGQFASLEYQVQAPGFSRSPGPFSRQWGDLLQFSVFADYAHGANAEGNPDSAEISGYGAGIRFGVPGTFSILFEGAKALSKREANDGDDTRFYTNLQWKF